MGELLESEAQDATLIRFFLLFLHTCFGCTLSTSGPALEY